MAVQHWTEATFELTPAGSDSPAAGDDRIRELKETLGDMLDKEHLQRDAGSTAAQGWHREGSAIAYYESAAPTNRPDGTTALGATDAGRLWIDSDDGSIWFWNGSAFDQATPGTAENDYLDGLDQSLATTDDVTFNSVTADVTGDLTGDVTGDVTGGIVETGAGGLTLKVARVALGAWNMDTTTSLSVSAADIGVTNVSQVCLCQTIIFHDNGVDRYDLVVYDRSSSVAIRTDNNDILLTRLTSGNFDSANFDGGSNRGYMTVIYSTT